MKIFKLETSSIQGIPHLAMISSASGNYNNTKTTTRYFLEKSKAEFEKKKMDDAATTLGIHNTIFAAISEIEIEE